MKSIELGIKKENIGGQNMFFSDYELLKMAINFRPKEQGFDVDEMMKRLRIMGELEKQAKDLDIKDGEFVDSMLELKATLDLEDADYDKLKSLVKVCQWGVVSQTIIDLYQKFK
jgi:hypothetical protein